MSIDDVIVIDFFVILNNKKFYEFIFDMFMINTFRNTIQILICQKTQYLTL